MKQKHLFIGLFLLIVMIIISLSIINYFFQNNSQKNNNNENNNNNNSIPLPPLKNNPAITQYRTPISTKSLLSNPRITKAIAVNPLTKSKNYQPILLQKINDLETNNTKAWSNYRLKNSWNEDEQLELYLQKVAYSLYVEAKGLTPWSIMDYSDQNLQLLLSDSYIADKLPNTTMYKQGGYYRDRKIAVFNGNPLIAQEYITQIVKANPEKQIITQKDMLDVIIINMRKDNWIHFSAEDPEQCADFSDWDLQCLLNIKKGSDIFMAEVIYALLQSQNIPSKEMPAYLGGHTGIQFPSLGLSMKGNDVYEIFRAGIIKRPNYLPIDLTYDTIAEYNEWNKNNPCIADSLRQRKEVLNYLQLYNDKNYNKDIIAAYCFSPANLKKGEYLTQLINKNIAIQCLNNDQTKENYEPNALSTTELQYWITEIAAIAQC